MVELRTLLGSDRRQRQLRNDASGQGGRAGVNVPSSCATGSRGEGVQQGRGGVRTDPFLAAASLRPLLLNIMPQHWDDRLAG